MIEIKLSETLGLRYSNGYYLVDVYSINQKTQELYRSSTKTYAALSGVLNYLECNDVPKPENLLELATEARLQDGIDSAKQGNIIKKGKGNDKSK